MKQKELAALLGISGAMVSKLAARGMPTDTLERAMRWRKRHLEPGRVKGSKFDPTKAPSNPESVVSSVANRDQIAPVESRKQVRALAQEVARLLNSSADGGAVRASLAALREVLRELPADSQPKMPVCVWVALVDWVLSEHAPVREGIDTDSEVTPDQFAALVCPDHPHGAWLSMACDWDGYSVCGLPEVDD